MGKTSKEKMEKWRKNNREYEREKDKVRKRKKKEGMTEEELSELKLRNRLNKQRSRANMSRQKKQAIRVKDRVRKSKEKVANNPANVERKDYSTPRVREFRKREKEKIMVVQLPFGKKKSLTNSQRKGLKKTKEFVQNVSSPTRRARIVSSIVQSAKSSPRTRNILDSSIEQQEEHRNARRVINKLKMRKDNSANVAKRLIVGTVASGTPLSSLRSSSANLGVSFRTLKKALFDLESIDNVQFITHMSRQRNSFVLTDSTRKLVLDFYEEVGRECPYRKSTVTVNGEKRHVLFLEKTLTEYYNLFKSLNPELKIGQTSFEKLRPKNVKLKSQAKRQVCCCTHHVNADYLRTKLNDILRINEQAVIKDNESLVSKTLCSSDSIPCIERDCQQCGVDNLDSLAEHIQHCSLECRINKEDCSDHTIKFLQFKNTSYTTNKGQTKKKVALVSERITISQFFTALKQAMQGFARHRFNHFHTKEIYKMAIEGLQEGQLIKVQDFSENYTCLVPDEVQSLHWTQTQATLFPVVTFRKGDSGKLLEDHLVFISDDLEHDCAFVELVNAKIHSYYQQAGVEIVRDIEFNDGCAAQFKSIKSFGLFSKRSIHTDRVYFESSHGKGPSDGVGGVIKSLVATAVCSQRVIIRDAKEFFDFLSDRCCIENEIGTSDKHRIKTRKFFFLDKQDVNQHRDSFNELPYKTLKGTRKIHQITIHNSLKLHELAIRNYACLCESCAQMKSDISECENFQMLQGYGQRKVVNLLGTALDEDSDDEMCDELQDDKEEWEMSGAVNMIKKDDIVVIRSVDTFNPYYLVKAMDEAFQLKEMFADDYGHTFPPNHSIVKGHYLEVQQRKKDDCFMFEDETKVVAISAFCIAGISPPLTRSTGIRKRKPITLYEISPEINDVLLGLVTGYNI